MKKFNFVKGPFRAKDVNENLLRKKKEKQKFVACNIAFGFNQGYEDITDIRSAIFFKTKFYYRRKILILK